MYMSDPVAIRTPWRAWTQEAAALAPLQGAARRVVHVIGDGRPGGGTTFVLNLASALATNGFESVIVSQHDSYLLDQARKTGCSAVGLEFESRSLSVRSVLRIRRQLRELAPALLHVHGARAGLPIALSFEWARIPTIYTVHGLHFHHKSGLSHAAGRAAASLCFRCARETVFVSEGDRKCAQREGILRHARRHSVLFNAIPPLATSIVAQARGGETHDIVFLGRLEPQKNPLLIADILAVLRPFRPSICIVGGGSLEGDLRRRIDSLGLAEQVTWCGALDHDSALRQAAFARLMLLPSLWEGHPLSVIETMQLGLPVVASNVPGTDEIVIDGETGYLVSSTDVASYAARIRALLLDDRLRERMGKAAAARIATHFSFDEHIRRHVELYDRHLSRMPDRAAGLAAGRDGLR
jgi:glycosyltransferase involved in cell wall biosynthesis